MKYLVIILIAVAALSIAWTVKSKASQRQNKTIAKHIPDEPQPIPTSATEEEEPEAETIMENEYLKVFRNGYGDVTVYFEIEEDIPMAIGDRMQEINENAYMNGYGWEVLLNFVMEQRSPELLDSINTDSEAGTYVAYFPDNEEGVKSAKALANLIVSLIEHEEDLLRIVKEHGDEIEWENPDF